MATDSKFQRQTAYKMQISDLLKGKMNFEGDRFTSLETLGKNVVRVNMIANIIEKYANPEKQFASLTIDDGSGQIRMKGFSDSFEILNAPMIGDTAYILGMLRFYNDELYLMPEIIKIVDPKWLALRKLELGIKDMPSEIMTSQEIPKIEEKKEEIVTQKIEISKEQISSPKLKVLNHIKKDNEVDIEQLIVPLNIPLADLNIIIKDLIQEGEIYESKPGHLCAI